MTTSAKTLRRWRPLAAGACWLLAADALIAQESKLTASDAATNDRFGTAVALSGETALIGANVDDSSRGAAYLFERDGGGWQERAKWVASDGGPFDFFGAAVALCGDTAIVGAPLDGDTAHNAGSAYVFVRAGTHWVEQAKLTPQDGAASHVFGTSAAVFGDRALVGAPMAEGSVAHAGAAYVFVRSGTLWREADKLAPGNGAAQDRFGISVALWEDTAIVGADFHDAPSGTDAGGAYVFAHDGASWREEAYLTASTGNDHEQFGFSVALRGERALVGAYRNKGAGPALSGAAYVYVRTGTSWTEEAILKASDADVLDAFGISVSLSANRALIGAFGEDHAADDSGSAYVFERAGTSWRETGKLAPGDGAEDDNFGVATALSDDWALVGANLDDDGGTNSGSAYGFSPPGLEPRVYCTAKSGLVCGVPAIGFSGAPSASSSSGFVIDAGPALRKRRGFFLYTDQGGAALPFDGGLLCLAPPLWRAVPVQSRGGAACAGEYTLDWNAFAHGGLGGAPQRFLLVPGQLVNVQVWGRDSVATGNFLSDALEFTVLD